MAGDACASVAGAGALLLVAGREEDTDHVRECCRSRFRVGVDSGETKRVFCWWNPVWRQLLKRDCALSAGVGKKLTTGSTGSWSSRKASQVPNWTGVKSLELETGLHAVDPGVVEWGRRRFRRCKTAAGSRCYRSRRKADQVPGGQGREAGPSGTSARCQVPSGTRELHLDGLKRELGVSSVQIMFPLSHVHKQVRTGATKGEESGVLDPGAGADADAGAAVEPVEAALTKAEGEQLVVVAVEAGVGELVELEQLTKRELHSGLEQEQLAGACVYLAGRNVVGAVECRHGAGVRGEDAKRGVVGQIW